MEPEEVFLEFSVEDLIAEARRMREEGLIEDLETPFGTVIYLKHELLG